MKRIKKYDRLIVVGLEELNSQIYDEIFELMQTNALIYFGMKKEQRNAELVCCLINYLKKDQMDTLLTEIDPYEIIIVYEEQPNHNLQFLSLAS